MPRRRCGATRVVQLSTTTFFDAQDAPLTEHSPLDPNPSDDPYTITKRAAYLDAMRRVEDDGQDICIVISGGAYGISPLPERSMVAPSYNARIALALAGRDHRVRRLPDPVGVRGRRRAGVGRRHPQGRGGGAVPRVRTSRRRRRRAVVLQPHARGRGLRPAGHRGRASPSSTIPTSPPASGPAWWRWPASSSRARSS